MNKKVARAQILKIKDKIAKSLQAEANLRKELNHYLRKFQSAKRCIEKGQVKFPRTKHYYLSAPKVQRVKNMANSAYAEYLALRDKLERFKTESEWLRKDWCKMLERLEKDAG